MFAFQKNTAQSQKLCAHAGTRSLVLVIVLVTCAALSFQGFFSTLAPAGTGSSAPFFPPASPAELGEGAVAPGGPKKNSATPIQEEQRKGRRSDETVGDPDYDLDGGESEEDGEFPVEHGGRTTSDPEEPPGADNMGLKSQVPSMESDASAVQINVVNISRTDQVVAKSSGVEKPAVLSSEEAMPEHCRSARSHAAVEKREPTTVSEMYQMLLENWRRSSCSMVPRWSSSPVDEQILEAKRQILGAHPMVGNDDDTELYSPVFRNVSMFKRSYELMEKTLKVYVYKDGEPPIFHRPPLGGIYASEGWFMRQMESSRRFAADDPAQAHLFYMPFSSSLLRFQLYVPGSHSHRNLVQHLRTYVAAIAGKYPFWNRTGGADHFLAACHDWATDETAKAMGSTIRALCNADLREGFEPGKDVSLPETNVRSGASGRDPDPQRDLIGGRAPSKKRRPFLAFFAGQMHGYLRPLLLQHWENKHPDMKISGPLPPATAGRGGGRRKRKKRKTAAAYAEYMRSSRYCICPRGYEVNSPRVVEAIVHGCVPVVIADGFVPPFFEVLDWEAFAVVLPEAEVPRLREVLEGIPRKKFLALQAGVREVRRHFLWNRRPARYDLFHMILHSVWLNRVLGFRGDG